MRKFENSVSFAAKHSPAEFLNNRRIWSNPYFKNERFNLREKIGILRSLLISFLEMSRLAQCSGI
jgi:hypothetical protein